MLGGISFVIMISKIYSGWPNFIIFIVDILATIQLIQMTIFGFIKGFYALYILKNYPELLEVRKEHLDRVW